MVVLDADFATTDLTADEADGSRRFSPAPPPEREAGDLLALYERERARADREQARADAAQARCAKLRQSERTARSKAKAWETRFGTCRGKLTAAEEEKKKLRRKVDGTLSLQPELNRLEALLSEADAETGGRHTRIASVRMMIAQVCAAMQAVEDGRRGPTPKRWRCEDGGVAALEQENKKLRKDLWAAEDHKATIRRQNDEIVRLARELRRLRDQRETVRSLSEEAYRLRTSLAASGTQNGRLRARLAKLIAQRNAFSKPIAGVQLRVALGRSRRQKQTITSQSKELRRLRRVLRASEARKGALESGIARLRAVRETLATKLSDMDAELRVVLRRSRRQKQTITSQSKDIRRLRRALRTSEARKGALESGIARLRAVRETLAAKLSGMDAELRKVLRRSRRQKATIKSLSRENARLRRTGKGLRNRIEALEAENAKLRATGKVLSKRLYGRKSEQQEKPRSERKRGQQRGAPGHGRTQRPGLEERPEVHTPPPEACVCARCGQPYAPNGIEESTLVEIEVKAHKRVIQRERFRRTCACASSPIEVSAPPVPRLFRGTPYGITFWARFLFELCVCLRPVKRIAAWMSAQGLPVSPGTLANSLKRFVPLFSPLFEAILAHQNEAVVRHADETSWRVRELAGEGRSNRAWLWTSVSHDAVCFHIDASRSAEAAEKLFAGIVVSAVIVCDRYSAYKKLARMLGGLVILAFCWSHMRRDFIEAAAGQARLTQWCQGWVERIAEIYRLNDDRLKHYNPALKRQTPAFDAAQTVLKEAVDTLFAQAERELAVLPDTAREAKALRSLVNHREGLCVFVDRPFVPLDNNVAERILRNPAIGRLLSHGSDSVKGAEFTAILYSVLGTLSMNGIDVLRWLGAWLTACAKNGGKPPADLSPWLPWTMTEERRREFTASG